MRNKNRSTFASLSQAGVLFWRAVVGDAHRSSSDTTGVKTKNPVTSKVDKVTLLHGQLAESYRLSD